MKTSHRLPGRSRHAGLQPASAARAQDPLSRELLLLLAGLAALGALATNIILPAFPAIGADVGASVAQLGATLGSFFLAFALGQLVVGPLSDRFGRRPLVLAGVLVFVAGSALCAAAATLPQLVCGRVIQALGVCATAVLSRAIARDLFDGAALARALSLIMVAMAAAPGFSPLLGTAITRWLGWRATFALVALLALLLAAHYLLRLGETHAADRRGALSFAATARTYRQLLRDRRFIAPALSASLVIGALYAFFAMAPAILMAGFGFSPLELGCLFAATVFVVFGAGLMAPRLAQRWGLARAARAGLALALASGIALLAGPAQAGFFCAALTGFLLGMGLVNPLATACALQPFGAQAGAASALLGFLQMGCAAAAVFLGAALDGSAQAALGLILCTSLTLALGIFVLRGPAPAAH